MKTLFALLLLSISLNAEDWTIGGKTYRDVSVGQVEADCVHITYSNGIGSIKIVDMPPELQKRFGFDPIAAKAASDAKAKALADAEASLPIQPKAVEVTPPVSVTKSSPSVDKSAIQSQIAALQADVDQKTEIQTHDGRSRNYSGNGFRDIIASEQAEIVALKSQLR